MAICSCHMVSPKPCKEHGEPKMVRFCSICGEREDSPFLTRWCDDWSYTEQPRGTHVWGHPKKVWDRE